MTTALVPNEHLECSSKTRRFSAKKRMLELDGVIPDNGLLSQEIWKQALQIAEMKVWQVPGYYWGYKRCDESLINCELPQTLRRLRALIARDALRDLFFYCWIENQTHVAGYWQTNAEHVPEDHCFWRANKR